jgi:octaprenyl-diphosphate synthase
MAMIPSLAVASLRETGTKERAGDRVARRLADVHDALGIDMAWVDRELARATSDGRSPATDSASHLLSAGGKRVRPLTVLLGAACFGEIPRAARELAVVSELVHLATLLHDDVIDDGQERRGRPTSRRLWGNAVSVLAGDLLLTHALERTSACGPSDVLADLLATLRALVDGEVLQLRGRTKLEVDEASYFQIVRDKTASLFAWAARAGARAAGAPSDQVSALGEFGGHVGVAFQLVDDALDYAGSEVDTGKTVYADLREGKLTLPLIRAMALDPSLAEDVRAVRDAADGDAATRIVASVRAASTCDDVRALARAATDRALAALETLPRSTPRELLACIAEELATRAA